MDRLTYLFKQYDNILGWYQKAESKGTLLEIKGARRNGTYLSFSG